MSSEGSPEAAALAARQHLGVGESARIDDIVRLVEEEAGIPVVLAKLPDGGPEGVYTRVRSKPFIFVNSASAPVRQRFTLAHELGHHWLGHKEVWDQEIHFADRDPNEVAANRFAAEFLVPRAAIHWWLGKQGDPDINLEILVRLAHHFRVSCEMARYRLENARRLQGQRQIAELDGAIADRDHRRLQLQLGLTEPEDSIALAADADVRVPDRMKANILWAVAQGLVEPDLAARRLRISEQQVADELRRQGVDAESGVREEPGLASEEWTIPPVPTRS
jgi:Zn-dependent peptidase ImmA (M78 family)